MFKKMQTDREFYWTIVVLLGVALGLMTSCAAPDAAWTAAGHRAMEFGVQVPLERPAFSVELSTEVQAVDEERCEAGKKKPCFGTARGHKKIKDAECESYDALDFDVRAGLRWDLAEWAHVAVGANTDLDPYARLGLEKRLDSRVSIGVDLVEDHGEQVLFGITWRR